MSKCCRTTSEGFTRAALAWVVCFAVVLFIVITVSTASATPPDSPPGQGECEHGNSGQPCRPDPQPEHGKDCEEHGPFEGGVNEDHCAGVEASPSPTPTTSPTPEPSPTLDPTPDPTPSVGTTPEASVTPQVSHSGPVKRQLAQTGWQGLGLIILVGAAFLLVGLTIRKMGD